MSAQFYNLTFNSYQEKLCSGFSNLQQKEEFVDMTLAAEGYLVKVHKSIIALASPYLKEMISSIPCDHPIIYISNINHKILTLIVEYIYTGEVQVPMDNLQSFLKQAKDLQLLGLNSVSSLQDSLPENTIINVQPKESLPETHVTNTMLDFGNTNINEYNTEATPDNTISDPANLFEDLLQMPINTDADIVDMNTADLLTFESNEPENIPNITVKTDYKPQQYSVSSRGCLQLIMNRFIYLMHHTSYKGFKRRWRCLDYRRKGCKAFIDTEGDIITNRSNTHTHPFHDDKILRKAENNLIYASIKSIEVVHKESTDKNAEDSM